MLPWGTDPSGDCRPRRPNRMGLRRLRTFMMDRPRLRDRSRTDCTARRSRDPRRLSTGPGTGLPSLSGLGVAPGVEGVAWATGVLGLGDGDKRRPRGDCATMARRRDTDRLSTDSGAAGEAGDAGAPVSMLPGATPPLAAARRNNAKPRAAPDFSDGDSAAAPDAGVVDTVAAAAAAALAAAVAAAAAAAAFVGEASFAAGAAPDLGPAAATRAVAASLPSGRRVGTGSTAFFTGALTITGGGGGGRVDTGKGGGGGRMTPAW